VKISKIEPQKRNKTRSTIYINGKFAFGLSNEILLKYDLNDGDEIDDDLIQNVLLAQERQRIRERAFRILRYRRRTVKELKARLLRLGFENNLVDDVLEELVQDKTLDDTIFAEAFAADYTKLKPKGNIFIRRELTKKGISEEIIENLIQGRDERFLVEEFIQKKLARFNLKDPKDKRRIIQRLLTRGFTPSVVYEVLNAYAK
jgi:regulatory protein